MRRAFLVLLGLGFLACPLVASAEMPLDDYKNPQQEGLLPEDAPDEQPLLPAVPQPSLETAGGLVQVRELPRPSALTNAHPMPAIRGLTGIGTQPLQGAGSFGAGFNSPFRRSNSSFDNR